MYKNSRCYKFNVGPLEWNTAKTMCNIIGGYLAVPSDIVELTFLRSIISSAIWIGLNDIYSGNKPKFALF